MQRFKNLKPEHLLSFAFVACALRVLYKICMIYRNSHKSFFLFSSRNLIVSSITFGSLIYLEFFIYWNAFLSHSWRPSKQILFAHPLIVWYEDMEFANAQMIVMSQDTSDEFESQNQEYNFCAAYWQRHGYFQWHWNTAEKWADNDF